jgi:chromosome partitioning protein
MSIVSVINQKGGVAKTTTSLNVAAQWAKAGKKVLLIDLDPQASATKAIFGSDEFDHSIYDIIIEKLPPEKAVQRSPVFDIDVIPSEIMVSGVDIQIAAHYGRERILAQRLEPLKRKYDAIIIDCPPSLGLLTVNALMASKDIIIPICPEYFSVKGIELILETLSNIQRGLGHKVDVRGIVITRYKDRKIANKVIEDIKEQYDLKVFKEYIPDQIVVEEAHHKHMPVYKYSPSSRATSSYAALSKELWK